MPYTRKYYLKKRWELLKRKKIRYLTNGNYRETLKRKARILRVLNRFFEKVK